MAKDIFDEIAPDEAPASGGGDIFDQVASERPAPAAQPEQGNWLSRWVNRQAPLKQAGESLAELPGHIYKAGTTAVHFLLPSQSEDEAVGRGEEPAATTAEQIQQTVRDPAYQFGKKIEEKAHGITGLTDEERKGITSKAAAMGVGFIPIIASGPLAPATIGIEAFSDHIIGDYEAEKGKGKSDDEAANTAMVKALTSGGIQGAVFAFLPKPLRKLGDKYLIEKFGDVALKRFFAARAAQFGEGAGLGAASKIGENLVENPSEPFKDVGAAATGLGAMQALTGAAGRVVGGKPDMSGAEAEAFDSGPKSTPDPRAMAWAATFGAAGPQADTAIRSPEARVVPGPYVPPEPGPLRTIPDVRKQGRLRVNLPAAQGPPAKAVADLPAIGSTIAVEMGEPAKEVTGTVVGYKAEAGGPQVPVIQSPGGTMILSATKWYETGRVLDAKKGEGQNAPQDRKEQPPVQLPGVTPGAAVPANEEEIRQAASEQTGGGDSAQASGNVPQEKTPDSVAAGAMAEKVARIKDIQSQIEPLAKKGGLTSSEAEQFQKLNADANSLRYEIAQPLTLEQIPSADKRQSTLSPEVVMVARNDLARNKEVYDPIIESAVGVFYGADTAVDRIMRGSNPKVSAQQLYDAFSSTREAMRNQYGDSIKLFRAVGKQKWKPTSNWATTESYARQFGDKIISRNVPIGNVIAVNVGLRGKYHEVIVGEPPPNKSVSSKKAAATREGNRTPDLIDWIEGNYPKGIRVSSAKEFGGYVDRAKGAAKKILFKEKPDLETADTVMRAASDEGYVFGSEDEFLQAVLDAGASREENAARQKREAEAGERAGKFQAATQKGKLIVSPDKLKAGDVVTVDRERLTVKRIDAGSGEVTLRGGEKFGEQTVRFGQKFYAQRFEAAKGRQSKIAGDLFEGTQREPAAVEKPEAAPVSGVKESSPADTGGVPEQGLSTAENKELSGYVLRDRAVREEKEGAKPLTSAERQRYDELMAKAGQEGLPMGQSLAIKTETRTLAESEFEEKARIGRGEVSVVREIADRFRSQPSDWMKRFKEADYDTQFQMLKTLTAGTAAVLRRASTGSWYLGKMVENAGVLDFEPFWRWSDHPQTFGGYKNETKIPYGADIQTIGNRTLAHLDELFGPSDKPPTTTKTPKEQEADAIQSMRDFAGSLTPEQEKAVAAAQKYRVKNAGPQTFSIVERLAQSEAEKEAGEQPVKIKNDKTGKEEVVLEADLQPVKTRTAAEREASKGMSRKELDEALLKAGMEPSEFPDAASKRAALKRFKAKGGKASLEDQPQAPTAHDEITGRPTRITGREVSEEQAKLVAADSARIRAAVDRVYGQSYPGAAVGNYGVGSGQRVAVDSLARGGVPVVELSALGIDPVRLLGKEQRNWIAIPSSKMRQVGFGFEGVVFVHPLGEYIYKVYIPTKKGIGTFYKASVSGGRINADVRYGTIPEVIAKIDLLNHAGGTPTEIVGITEEGAVVTKQPFRERNEPGNLLADEAKRMGLEKLPDSMIDAGYRADFYAGIYQGKPWIIGDFRDPNLGFDTEGKLRVFDHNASELSWEQVSKNLKLDAVYRRLMEIGDRSRKFQLDNEGQGGIRHEDVVAEVERARHRYPKAPPMKIVDRPDWVSLGEDGNHYGIKGLWNNGRIWLNKAYLKDALDARATLEHEMVHPLLETKEGVKAVEEALRYGLGRANMDALIRQYGDRYAAQEEWFAKLAEKNQSLWKRIVDHVRVFLSKVGLVNLSDEEIGRGIIRMLRNGRRDAGGPVYGSLIEPSDLSKASLTDDPIEPGREGPAAEEAPRRNRHQVAGVKQLGSEYEVENIERIRGAVRAQFFDGSQPVSEGMSEAAWNMLQDLTDPATRQGNAEQVRNLAGGEMAPGLLRNELWNYALRLSFQQRDPSLLRFMVERNQDIATLGGGGSDTQAGRALRAAQDRATGPLWANLVELTRQRARSGARALGVGEDLFNELLGTIDSLDISAEDLERMVVTGTDTRGRPVREVFEEMSPEAREAERILDQYERSQTEWLKPEKQLSIIRQIIRDSIQGGPAARYRQQAEFVDFVSRRFQEATVPKEIADRLAFEVWKDKQAREASATAKAIRGEETKEQRNAETLLDQWAKEQTEWVKPERRNQTKDIIKEFMARNVDKNNPDAFRSPLAERLRGIGVPDAVAREVAVQAWNRKLTFDDAKLARALEIERDRAAKQAERIAQSMVNRLEASQTEWVKPDGAPTVAKIIAEALRPLSAVEKRELKELSVGRDTTEKQARYDALRGRDVLPEADPASFMAPLRGKLVAAGVTEATAYRLAREIYNKRVTDWTTARARAMERAAESGSLRSLIEAIKGSPYRAQKDAAWRLKTATEWFMSNGLAREQAEAAAKLFDAQFAKALATAAERNAQRILKDKEPKTLRDVIQAIRAGLTDPDKSWPDEIAKRDGYKPLTKEQHARIAELEAKLSAPEISTAEQVQITEQIMGVFRHAGWKEGATARFIAGSYANSLLSGIRTAALHVFQPMSSLLLRDVPLFVTQNLHRPRDILTAGRTVIEASKTWFPEAKFAWQNDAYTFSSHEMSLMHNELKRQYEIAKGELSSKSPKGILKGALRMLYAWQHFVTRVLQTANQAGMAITRDVKLALYGSTAMKEAGLSTKEISELVDVAIEAKNAAYEDALLRGMDKTTAAVVADERANDALAKFFSNAVGDQKGREIIQAAENDAYSIVGRRAPGISEEDEGWASKPITGLMQAITKMRARSGQESMLTIAMFGFVNVPLRLARYHLNSGPYALLRYGIDRYRAAHGKETFWKQSFANSLQVKQRLLEGLFGTGLMVGGGLLAAQFHSSDEDLQKRHWGVYFTGAGPKSRVLRDAWQKRGFRPYSIQFVVGGTMVNFPLTRVGQVFAQPFALAATMDDAEWARKEAAAAGKEVPQKISQTLGLGVGNYYHMVLGDMGLFQAGEHMVRLGRGEKNIGSAVADQLSGVAAATVIPGKQLLSNISEMIFGPLDRSSVQSSIAANFPVLGAHWQQKAINRFGDQLYDQSLYGKASKLGIPFAVRVSDTPENRQLYGLMVNKGAAAPDLRRYVIEEKYGPLSDEQWSKFAKVSGDSLKKSVLSSLEGLKDAPAEEVKKFLVKMGSVANQEAAAELALNPVKVSQREFSGGAAGPDVKINTSGRGIPGPVGESSGIGRVTPAKIPGTAGAGAGYGKRLATRAGVSRGLRGPGASGGGLRGRRLVSGKLRARSTSGGRLRRIGVAKTHRRRLSLA